MEEKGKLVNFANYLLPIQYETGVIKEHLAVRTAAGLFDVSHMAEFKITGKDALKNVNYLLTNDFTKLSAGQVRYSLMCNQSGGVLDDILVYCYSTEQYLLVANAVNHEKDASWIQANLHGEVHFSDESKETALLALQGPKATNLLSQVLSITDLPEKYYTFKENVSLNGTKIMISKTGYTGETGYELYVPAKEAPHVWELLRQVGKLEGLIPCGLGARDTLRLEASMPLYGHEMNEKITPFEAKLGFAVKMKKEDFIGKSALSEKMTPKVIRIGLKAIDRGIIREGTNLYKDNQLIGEVTSGTQAPFLGYAIAMALVEINYQEIGTILEADVRGRRIKAEVVALPFYQKSESIRGK